MPEHGTAVTVGTGVGVVTFAGAGLSLLFDPPQQPETSRANATADRHRFMRAMLHEPVRSGASRCKQDGRRVREGKRRPALALSPL
jgi:hypothetical protein